MSTLNNPIEVRAVAGNRPAFEALGWLLLSALLAIGACADPSADGMPSDCEPGTQNCVCRSDRSCDRLGGTPMSCIGGLCVETSMAEPGTLGGACGPDVPCTTSQSGEALECVAGVCELAGCPSGSLGCPCGQFGQCDAFEGVDLACGADLRCQADCEPGSGGLGCACLTDTCEGATECIGGFCRPDHGLTLDVLDDTIRACDILIQEEAGAPVVSVEYDANVMGESLRQAPLVGISVAARANTPIVGTVARIILPADAPVDATVELVTVECFDDLGVSVGSDGLVLE